MKTSKHFLAIILVFAISIPCFGNRVPLKQKRQDTRLRSNAGSRTEPIADSAYPYRTYPSIITNIEKDPQNNGASSPVFN